MWVRPRTLNVLLWWEQVSVDCAPQLALQKLDITSQFLKHLIGPAESVEPNGLVDMHLILDHLF
jgi:hypothetical protein